MARDEDDDDDRIDRVAPTPRTSESFSFFAQAAFELADRLEQVFHKLKVEDRFKARTAISELRELHRRFAAWPTMDGEVVSKERPRLTSRLMTLNRTAEEILLTTKP